MWVNGIIVLDGGRSFVRLLLQAVVQPSLDLGAEIIKWGQGRTNTFVAARGEKMTMCPFFKFLRPFVIVIIHLFSTKSRI